MDIPGETCPWSVETTRFSVNFKTYNRTAMALLRQIVIPVKTGENSICMLPVLENSGGLSQIQFRCAGQLQGCTKYRNN